MHRIKELGLPLISVTQVESSGIVNHTCSKLRINPLNHTFGG
jgi:hypothetical protein